MNNADNSLPTFLVKELRKTCDACPAQWEGLTYGNKHIYIRYRFGCFQASVADTEDDAVLSGDLIAHSLVLEYGHNFAGEMDKEEMLELTEGFLDFSKCQFLSDDEKFFIYNIPQEKLTTPEYNPSFALTSIAPLVLGDQVEHLSSGDAVEITADKQKYIVDPNRIQITELSANGIQKAIEVKQ